MIKKIFVISLCVALILTVGNSAFATSTISEFEPSEFEILQSEAIEAYSIFCSEILYRDNKPESDFSPRPDWYGGAYMDDSFNLCIKVLEGHEDVTDEIAEHLKSYPIVFETTDVSYNELADIYCEISTELSGWNSLLFSQRESKVFVRYDPNDDNCQEMIDDISRRYSCVEFEERSTPSTFLSTNIIGGNPLRSGSTTGFGTIGFSCKFKPAGSNSLIDGFLTAGHVALDATSLYLGNGTSYPISYSSSNSIIQFTNGGYGDYAFLPANGNTLTNHVRISSSMTTTITAAHTSAYQSILTGTYVNKYGATTGITNGILMGVASVTYPRSNYTYVTINGVWEVYGSGFSSTNMIAGPGDSGAPVWQTTSGVNKLMGILSGGKNNSSDPNENGKYYYFTPFYTMGLNSLEYGDDFVLQLS